jgi:hypothetical protein
MLDTITGASGASLSRVAAMPAMSRLIQTFGQHVVNVFRVETNEVMQPLVVTAA